MPSDPAGRHHGRPTLRIGAIVATVVLLVAGVVVTATAAPGPSSDVKTAQYGGNRTYTEPCSSTQFTAPGQSDECQDRNDAYAKAKKACKGSKPCLRKVERTKGQKVKDYVAIHKAGTCFRSRITDRNEAEECQRRETAYKAAKVGCSKKKTKRARKACLRKVERTKGKSFRDYVTSHKGT